MRLSDLYEGEGNINLELIVKVIDINFNENNEILQRCRYLYEYSWLVERIREYEGNIELEKAIDKALDDMLEDFVIKKLLLENKAEVKGMLLTEWDWEKEKIKLAKAERREGIIEGEKKGLIIGESKAYKDIIRVAKSCNSIEDLLKIISKKVSDKSE